jgi:hypothetical protein
VWLLAMTAAMGVTDVSAHRRDEYLQAARLAIEPGGVQLDLDLTPGIALADGIIADIDRNRDGSLSPDEQQAYATQVVNALTLAADGAPVRAQLTASNFPEVDAMRRGEGSIRIQVAGTLPRLSAGSHQLLFRNRHHPDRSVYLANALVPQSYRVSITGQRRDEVQSEITIDYILRAAPLRSTAAWLLGGIAVAAGLSVLMLRPQRSPR